MPRFKSWEEWLRFARSHGAGDQPIPVWPEENELARLLGDHCWCVAHHAYPDPRTYPFARRTRLVASVHEPLERFKCRHPDAVERWGRRLMWAAVWLHALGKDLVDA